MLGSALGGFSPAPGSPFPSGGSAPVAIVAGDFDDEGRDGIELHDLAIANHASNTISVLLSNGDGSFRQAPGSPFPSGGTGPSAIAAWDFNGDGQLDLAVTNEDSNSLAVWLGDGKGHFRMAPGFPQALTGAAPDALVAVDLDPSESRSGLAVGYSGAPGISILRDESPTAAFEPLVRPKLRPNGTIGLLLRAPVAGLFHVTAEARTAAGRHFIYGCGDGFGQGGAVSLTVGPTKQGYTRFGEGASLQIKLRSEFIRADEFASAGDVGDYNRLRPPKHRRKGIVHVSSQQELASTVQEHGRQRCPLLVGTL
jgi:FG-GAP-like repeat